MADSSSEDTTSGSESSTDNKFDKIKKKEFARHTVKRPKSFPNRLKESTSSPEDSGSKYSSSNKPHRENKKYQKKMISKESDDSTSSSSSNEETVRKKCLISSAAGRKKLPCDNEDQNYKTSSIQSENEIRNRIKERYIQQEHDKNYYHNRRQQADETDEKKQWKEYDRRHDYNDNERYIKNDEDETKYREEKRYIKCEDYNTQNNSKDDRKRKNEHSPGVDNEKRYHGHYKSEDGDYKRSTQREHGDDHKRHNDVDHRKHDSGDHRRHEHDTHGSRQNANERDWDKGKNEHMDADSQINRNWEGFGNNDISDTTKIDQKKEEANYKLSGKLTEYTNTYNGVVIMYNEPPEARKAKTKWRFYPFKGEKALTMLQLHRQSAFLLGRDRKVADIPVDHPSCSKQHAVMQFRLVEYEKPDGSIGKRVKPYIIDLDSRNGTHVNNKRIEARKYVELIEKDVIKFGFSSRDYVLLHEKSEDVQTSEDEGDVRENIETKKKK